MKTPMFLAAFASLAVFSLTYAMSVSTENSLSGPYDENGESLIFWDLSGSAELRRDHIRLTPDVQYKQGAIWNSFPCIPNNWEFQTHFHIHGKGVHLNGNGMALWYVRDVKQSGPVFGYKDYFSGLGIFIDTFENKAEPHQHRHPYISAVVNNGSLHYEHDEDGTMTQIGGCYAPVRNLQVPTWIAVSYINRNLAVYYDVEGLNRWELCFKSAGVHLPTGYYFGISASTDENSDNHDIIAVTTLNLDSDGFQEWEDRSNVMPYAENVEIRQKYRKEFIEDEEQKVEEKREIRREEEEEEDEEEETFEEEKKQETAEKKTIEEVLEEESDPEEKENKKESTEEQQNIVQERDVVKEEKEEEKEQHDFHNAKNKNKIPPPVIPPFSTPPSAGIPEPTCIAYDDTCTSSTSWLTIIVYGIVVIIVLLFSIRIFAKYYERRQERLHKRLY